MSKGTARTSLGDDQSRRDGWWIVPLLILICVLPVLVRGLWYPDYPGSDDAFIHLAVVRNLVLGLGWGLNPHVAVNLSTSPLFTVAFALLSRLVGYENLLALGVLLSSAAAVGSVFLCFAIAKIESKEAGFGLLAAALAASNIHLWRWTGSFLETTFAGAYVLGLILISLREPDSGFTQSRVLFRSLVFGSLVGVGALLRPETGLIGIAWALHLALNRRRHFASSCAVSTVGLAAVLVPYAVWAQLTFGSVVPTTLAAKSHSGVSLGSSVTASQLIIVFGSGVLGSLVLIAVAAAVAAVRTVRHRPGQGMIGVLKRGTILWATPLLVSTFYILKTEQLQSPARYLLPVMGPIPVLAALVWHQLTSGRIQARVAIWVIPIGVAAVQLAGALVVNDIRVAPVLSRMNSQYVATLIKATRELDSRCGPGDTALIWADIGVVSWSHDRSCELADAGGLASPELAGLHLGDMIEATGASFILECQGAPGSVLSLPGGTVRVLWSQAYLSHSVANPHAAYVARLYSVITGNTGAPTRPIY